MIHTLQEFRGILLRTRVVLEIAKTGYKPEAALLLELHKLAKELEWLWREQQLAAPTPYVRQLTESGQQFFKYRPFRHLIATLSGTVESLERLDSNGVVYSDLVARPIDDCDELLTIVHNVERGVAAKSAAMAN